MPTLIFTTVFVLIVIQCLAQFPPPPPPPKPPKPPTPPQRIPATLRGFGPGDGTQHPGNHFMTFDLVNGVSTDLIASEGTVFTGYKISRSWLVHDGVTTFASILVHGNSVNSNDPAMNGDILGCIDYNYQLRSTKVNLLWSWPANSPNGIWYDPVFDWTQAAFYLPFRAAGTPTNQLTLRSIYVALSPDRSCSGATIFNGNLNLAFSFPTSVQVGSDPSYPLPVASTWDYYARVAYFALRYGDEAGAQIVCIANFLKPDRPVANGCFLPRGNNPRNGMGIWNMIYTVKTGASTGTVTVFGPNRLDSKVSSGRLQETGVCASIKPLVTNDVFDSMPVAVWDRTAARVVILAASNFNDLYKVLWFDPLAKELTEMATKTSTLKFFSSITSFLQTSALNVPIHPYKGLFSSSSVFVPSSSAPPKPYKGPSSSKPPRVSSSSSATQLVSSSAGNRPTDVGSAQVELGDLRGVWQGSQHVYLQSPSCEFSGNTYRFVFDYKNGRPNNFIQIMASSPTGAQSAWTKETSHVYNISMSGGLDPVSLAPIKHLRAVDVLNQPLLCAAWYVSQGQTPTLTLVIDLDSMASCPTSLSVPAGNAPCSPGAAPALSRFDLECTSGQCTQLAIVVSKSDNTHATITAVVASMTVFLAICAISIVLFIWYRKKKQAAAVTLLSMLNVDYTDTVLDQEDPVVVALPQSHGGGTSDESDGENMNGSHHSGGGGGGGNSGVDDDLHDLITSNSPNAIANLGRLPLAASTSSAPSGNASRRNNNNSNRNTSRRSPTLNDAGFGSGTDGEGEEQTDEDDYYGGRGGSGTSMTELSAMSNIPLGGGGGNLTHFQSSLEQQSDDDFEEDERLYRARGGGGGRSYQSTSGHQQQIAPIRLKQVTRFANTIQRSDMPTMSSQLQQPPKTQATLASLGLRFSKPES